MQAQLSEAALIDGIAGNTRGFLGCMEPLPGFVYTLTSICSVEYIK
jgi:hypothetical protein